MIGRIIVCADDYALAPGVSHAIRMLASAHRISATSAIVTRPRWTDEAAALKPHTGDIAVGLHLNLTLGRPLSTGFNANNHFSTLKPLIAMATLRRLDPVKLSTEIEAQLNSFESGMGGPPDFVDGHEHVHVLPVIRPVLLDVLKRRYGGRSLLIRDPVPTRSHSSKAPPVKSLVLSRLARNLHQDIEAYGFISNDTFGGVTTFSATPKAVAAEFSEAARIEGWRPLVMCHPGFPDAELARIDAITQRRQLEYDALMGSSPLGLNAWRPVRTSGGAIQWPHTQKERGA